MPTKLGFLQFRMAQFPIMPLNGAFGERTLHFHVDDLFRLCPIVGFGGEKVTSGPLKILVFRIK
jgi:hypothetical protein